MAADGGLESDRAAEALAERPELDPYWLAPIYDAFTRLSRSRPMGMEAGAIPLSEILHYAEVFRPEDDDADRREFVELVLGLDAVFLEHQAGLTKRQRKTPQAPAE
ncbi:MAG: hypothetical protein JSR82_24425 [Verrucomicrobia bacterium]|nr:hypothetical protein [Verrucomicrobiota bacterium]